MKFIFLIFILVFFVSCGGTTTGNPLETKQISVTMQDQQPFAWIKKSWDMLIPSAYANVSSIKFCFKRLRFKPDSSTDGRNFDLVLGEVTIDPNGTNLLTVAVPEGLYERVEFDLEKECEGTPSKPSVLFTNDFGTFSTLDNMTIKFDGQFTVSTDSTITLNIDALLDALEPVTNDNQIKTSLEAVSGDF